MATVALIQGADGRHRRFFLEALRDLEAVTAVAVVDPDGGATVGEARALMPDKPVRHYASYRRAAPGGGPWPWPSSPSAGPSSPAAIAPLLEAGVPVLAEKPACVDPDEFARLVETAERRGVPLMLALCNRLAPWSPPTRGGSWPRGASGASTPPGDDPGRPGPDLGPAHAGLDVP